MSVIISGKNINIGESLHEHIHDSIEKQANKHFNRKIDVRVTISKEGKQFEAIIIVNDETSACKSIIANYTSPNAFTAFDGAAIKLNSKLCRYKDRIRSNKKRSKNPKFDVKYYLINNNEEEDENEDKPPLIIEEQNISIECMSVKEAVATMDLISSNALLFINIENNRINFIYKRQDNNIAWCDPGIPNE